MTRAATTNGPPASRLKSGLGLRASAFIFMPLVCLSLTVPVARAAIGDAAPTETGAKASAPATPGDAGKSGSAAGMTNGTGSRQGGAAGIGTHGLSDTHEPSDANHGDAPPR